MRKKLFIILLPIVFGLCLYWLSTHAFIVINVNTQQNGDIHYKLLDQSSLRAAEGASSGKTIKKLVRRGSHEVLITQGHTSHFSVVKVGGFLGSSNVDAGLSSEKARRFVGDNPGPCMFGMGTVIASSGCGDELANLSLHVPASSNTPTYIKQISSTIEGTVSGFVRFNEENILLVHADIIDDDEGTPYSLVTVNQNLDVVKYVPLAELDAETEYSLTLYKQGLLVYSHEKVAALHFDNINAPPATVTLPKPKSAGLRSYLVTTKGDAIVVAFSKQIEGLDADDKKSQEATSEIAILQNNSIRRFTFTERYEAIQLCGTNKLCLLNGGTLEVYDISSDKQELLFKVTGVQQIESIAGVLQVIKDKVALVLNVDNRTGHALFSLGDYSLCGSQATSGKLLLCLIDSKQHKVAVELLATDLVGEPIDKKVSKLLKIKEIENISVYDRYIFISPDYGEPVFNEEDNGYGYDKAVKQSVDKKLNDEISKLSIDKSAYTVINATD